MGFPTRSTRSAFGPRLEDRFPVVDPTKEIPASAFNLAFWQLAGLSLVTPRAIVVAKGTPSGVERSASQEAWNPDGGIVPQLTRESAGVYTVTYPATAKDEQGNSVSIALLGVAYVTPQTQSKARGWGRMLAPNVAEIRIADDSGAPLDAPFVAAMV